jgi:predicted dehydrogenase
MMSKSPEQLQIAIIGASGIGKNHAAWFVKNGARICAFAGTSESSLAQTQELLHDRIGYASPGYTNLQELFTDVKPDAVCIASPPEFHYEQVQMAFEHNTAVLCEKPLVYDPRVQNANLIAQAYSLAREATERSILFGTQMQYCFITDQLCELAGITSQEITSLTMEMETKNIKPGRSHETIWIELAPHPLSVLQRIAGEAHLDMDSIRCEVRAMETTARFDVQRSDGKKIKAQLIMRHNPDTTAPVRRFTLNGTAVNYAGRKNAAGEFLTYLSNANQEIEMSDPVDLLIQNFIAACYGKEPLRVTGNDGARNVSWMLDILERGSRT